jgi:quercetin dioxygenase-like cupin family protein
MNSWTCTRSRLNLLAMKPTLLLLSLVLLSPPSIAHELPAASAPSPAPAGERRTTVIQLPASPKEYFQILSPPRSVLMRSGLVTLAPGKNVGKHTTDDFEELVIPLEGEAEMTVSGFGKLQVRQGQILYAPPGTEHDVLNIGKRTLRYIYVVSRAPKP